MSHNCWLEHLKKLLWHENEFNGGKQSDYSEKAVWYKEIISFSKFCDIEMDVA